MVDLEKKPSAAAADAPKPDAPKPDAAQPVVEAPVPTPGQEEPTGEPITIDLGEAEPAAKPEPAPAVEPPAPVKPRLSLRKQVKDYQAAVDAAHRETEAAKAEAERLRGEKAVSDEAAMAHYGARVTLSVDAAKRALRDATAAGDADAIAEASEKLSRAASDAAQLDQWKASKPKPDGAAKPEPKPEPRPEARPSAAPQQVHAETAKWIETNPWFDRSNTAEFEPELATHAAFYAQSLERRMAREGKQAEIGGAAYFAEIDKHMREEFPDDFEAPAATPQTVAPKMKAPAASVTPATRTAVPAASPASETRVTLSPQEQSLAKSLPLKHLSGKPFTDAEKLKEYARNKIVDLKEQAEKRAAG